MATSHFQLLHYRFDRSTAFEGQLVGALERMESGGTLRIADVLVVGREATGELAAIAVRGTGAGGLVAPLVEFRLDPGSRRRSTAKVLRGELAPAVEQAGAGLAAGETTALVLVEHVWARAVEDAVSRLGGTRVSSDFVAASRLAELAQGSGSSTS